MREMQTPELSAEPPMDSAGTETGTEHGITPPEHANNEETGILPDSSEETGTISQERTSGQPGTTSQESTAGQPGTTSQESTAGQPGTTSQESTSGEPGTTSQESTAGQPGTTSQESTAEEPGTTSQDIEHETSTNKDTSNGEPNIHPDTTAAESSKTDEEIEREPVTTETMNMEEGIAEQAKTLSEDPGVTQDEADHRVTEDQDNDGMGILHELPEEQEESQGQLDALENKEIEPQQDNEPQDSSSEIYEDEGFREELIQQYQALVLEKEKVHQQNSQLQHKLYEYFRRKKGEETRPESEKHVSDQEQRYLKYLATLEEMRKNFKTDTLLHEQQIEELKFQCQEVVSQVNNEWTAFQEQKKKIALYVVNRGAGKHASSSYAEEVLQLQAKEERKENEVIQVRLENIKLKNQINSHESTLRSKEELSEGLHLIDFEQLKIENQTYNEKIEERNEELLKLRKKITNTVQVLTHMKEKLQFVQAENQEQKDILMEIEALVAHRRDILTRTKQARDSLRMDNLNLKQKCGLLGNKTLLRDFEEKVDSNEELCQKLESLKRCHAELTLTSKGVMRKIEDTKLVIES